MDLKSYSARRSYSDAHLEIVKAVLGRRFFHVSNLEQDTQHGVDLLIPSLTFAVRIRQIKYNNYNDFTIRTSGGGRRSEYAKLLDETISPDFMFYGFAMDKNTMAAGYLIDITQWRLSVLREEVKPVFRKNKDGSHFCAFPLRVPGVDVHYAEQII